MPPISGLKKGDVTAMIRAHLTAGQTAVDVGASDGHVSKVMRECVGPTGHVVAFEPRLAEGALPGTTLISAAVGAENGTQTLYLGEPPKTSSLWASAVKTRAGGKPSIEVPVVRLDDVVFNADLVKVDVQGGEMAVIDGAPMLLATCPVWILECWPWGLEQAGASALALYDRIMASGLTVQGVTRDDFLTWLGLAGEHHYVNLLCTR